MRMEKRNSYAKNARVNLLRILKTEKYLMPNGEQLTDFFLKKYPWLESQGQFQFQKDGFKNILKKRRKIDRQDVHYE